MKMKTLRTFASGQLSAASFRKILPAFVLLALAALVLAGTAAATQPAIDTRRAQEQLDTMRALLPGSTNFAPEEVTAQDEHVLAAYRGENGYVLETVADGYARPIHLWVGVDHSGKVTGVTVRKIAETAGLGQEALRDHGFLAQFLHTSGNAAAGENIETISGATVTTKSIAKAVNAASAYVTGAEIVSGATEWGG